jgi:hypothetical protein
MTNTNPTSNREETVFARCGKISLAQEKKTVMFIEDDNTTPRSVDLKAWLSSYLECKASQQCLIDTSVYGANRSLRLPYQSKICGGRKVRKFIPANIKSRPLDALMHYAHTDTEPIRGQPQLLSVTST